MNMSYKQSISQRLAKLLLGICGKKIRNSLSDELFLKLKYKAIFGQTLNLSSPAGFNEKLQWLKLYDRRLEYVTMVDKLEAKNYVNSVLGPGYTIPTYGCWNAFDEIDFDSLPEQFVLKTTHDSGTVVICKDRQTFSMKMSKQKLETSLRSKFWLRGREWPYKHVKPRIIAEKYMVDESGQELKDYKWLCFNGEPKALFIATERFSDNGVKFDFFDLNFNHLPFTNGHPNSTHTIAKPSSFEEMKGIAKKLSANIPHVRVDLYDINGKIYFGELTFYHFSGLVPFDPPEWDLKFGEWLTLPETTVRN